MLAVLNRLLLLLTLVHFQRKMTGLEEKHCGTIDVRNGPSAIFEQLSQELLKRYKNCTVIEGDVRFLVMTNESLTTEDFEVLRFPRLREIMGSLIVFQVAGITSLSYLFPELRIIRGKNLMHNYALVLFQNDGLIEIGLPNLVEISHGSVRIAENPRLCYAETVNWSAICRQANLIPSVIETNSNPNSCSEKCSFEKLDRCATRALSTKAVACWNRNACQMLCSNECSASGCNYTLASNPNATSVCCHEQCAGGCSGPTDKDCYACRNVVHDGRCRSKCPSGFYMLHSRRCISYTECLDRHLTPAEDPELSVYKAINSTGVCDYNCPIGYEENPNNRSQCLPCPLTGCLKRCKGAIVHSLSEAANFKGCNIVEGFVDITMQMGIGGNVNIVKLLEDYFKDIREIHYYVKVSFTPSLVSLTMFRNLRVIRGEKLWNEKYSFTVFENSHLSQLWNLTDNGQLEILNGSVQFQNNPFLCVKLIETFVDGLKWHGNVSMHDVSRISNGNKAVCEEILIDLKIVIVMADTIVLSWEEFNTSEMDHRMFLGYQVYYKAVDYENVSRFENRDACSDSWKMIFYDINERGVLLNGLKADTLYAIYVSTSVKSSPGAKGGLSPLIYVRTKFEAPSSVIIAKVESPDPTSIYMEWLPPEMPNGEVTHYRIAYSSKSDILTNERNYCDEPPNYSIREDKPLGFSDLKQETSINETSRQGTCSAQKCCECDRSKSPFDSKSSRRHSTPDDELINERAAFENAIHNIVFIEKSKEKKSERPKREAELAPVDQSSVFLSSTSMITTTTAAFTALPSTTSSSKYMPFFGGETGRALLNLLRKPVYKPIESWPIHRNNTTNASKSGDYYLFNVVNVTGLNYTITGLRHFTSYEIKIWACQNTSAEENFCSFFDVMRLKRTLLNESAETINFSSIVIQNISSDSHSESRFLKWDPPKSPNGFVVAYEVEYTRTSLSHSSQRTMKKECILVSKYNNSSGIFLHDLLPGNYSVSIRAMSLAQRGPWTPPKYFYIPDRASTNYVMVLLIVVSGIVALILLVFFFAFIYRKRWQRYVMKWVSGNPDYISQDNFYKADEWELKRESVKLGDIIGQGSFGVVYKGEGLNVTSIYGITFGPCAVKTVAQGRDILDRFYFLNEATVMKAFNTAHIVKLLGVVSGDGPTWVIMEYMEQGNLKDFLLSRRPDDANTRALPDLTLTETLLMAAQISDGMAYLEAHKFTHRDLAARNCMIAVDGTCKIGDFGMARDIHYRDYYRPCGRRMMPVRWMSPEALKDATFSSKSDVWAFGVVLWEITTLGRQPYPGLSNEEVINYVVDQRQTLKIPENTPQCIIDIFTRTWKYDPKDRPTFDDLLRSLKDCGDLKFKQRSYWYTQREAILKAQEELNKEKQHILVKNPYQNPNANPYEMENKPWPATYHDETMDEQKSAACSAMSACAENEQPVCNNNRRLSIIGWLRRFNPFGGDLSSSGLDTRSKKLLNSNVYRTTKGNLSLEC